MSYISHNGRLVPTDQPLITADNSSFKWGYGLFETMKVLDGVIGLGSYHFERLRSGLITLDIHFDESFIEDIQDQIKILCIHNNCEQGARVRLGVYRNNKGAAESVIQVVPLEPDLALWNGKGWEMDLFTEVKKTADSLANMKTASYLPYIVARQYAKEKGLDECILLNHKGAVCDGSRTNIFIVGKGAIYTPALEEGCIAGVMRHHIITVLSKKGIPVREISVTLEMLHQAQEIFVTNALIGIKWVQKFSDTTYGNTETLALYKKVFG